jgi:hypothetical protein
VGDSLSFGYLLAQEKSFPKLLEKLLHASGNTSWEVLNFSVPGYNIVQERTLIQTRVIRFRPDVAF